MDIFTDFYDRGGSLWRYLCASSAGVRATELFLNGEEFIYGYLYIRSGQLSADGQ